MPKQKLNLDTLAVESFDAAPAVAPMLDEALSGQRCSAVDACPSGRGCSVVSVC
ncbi:hypothetical protein [Longimicrobium sp.]|uniref:hypothetical protein n=1 Tax=Longimicrobium sp. TaxID=2029185 RepID=UPI002CFAB335|nr:hypothetical protein [Longimicrobium sp.]HSU13177.1 hypothetical protein [Longimicrobium sp.]